MSDKTPNQTNLEFVTDLMEFSRSGALAQIFIIGAIAKQASAVAELDPATISHPLISGEAWVRCAKAIRDQINAKYGDSYNGPPEPNVTVAWL